MTNSNKFYNKPKRMKEIKRETVNKKGTGKLAARFVNQLENRCKLLHITCGRRGQWWIRERGCYGECPLEMNVAWKFLKKRFLLRHMLIQQSFPSLLMLYKLNRDCPCDFAYYKYDIYIFNRKRSFFIYQ